RKLAVPPERLQTLCVHHRSAIREAAREAADKLGAPQPPPFDARRAVRAEPVRKLLDDIDQLIVDPAPSDAPFVSITTTTTWDNAGTPIEQKEIERGWLLGDTEKGWEILSPHGYREQYPWKDKTQIRHRTTSVSQLVRVPIEEEVERVTALRKK